MSINVSNFSVSHVVEFLEKCFESIKTMNIQPDNTDVITLDFSVRCNLEEISIELPEISMEFRDVPMEFAEINLAIAA